MSFIVEPHPLTSLPPLTHQNFSGTSLLKIEKLMEYVIQQLQSQEQEIKEQRTKTLEKSATKVRSTSPRPLHSKGKLEILCRDVTLIGSLDLISVHILYWKRGTNMILHYRLKGE